MDEDGDSPKTGWIEQNGGRKVPRRFALWGFNYLRRHQRFMQDIGIRPFFP